MEGYGQYGLSDPLCTISLEAGEELYEIALGDYSSMDSLRYVSFGDGNVYLAAQDPLDKFDISLRDLILNDEIPDFEQITQLTFSGAQNYSIFYDPDASYSYSEQDVYFTQQEGTHLPLDSSLIDSYLSYLRYLSLTDYAGYNATEQELQDWGLDQPELSLSLEYTGQDEMGEELEGSFVLHLGVDSQTRSEAEQQQIPVGELEDEDISAYLRMGDSSIVCHLTPDVYTALTAASCDDFRHRQVLWVDWQDITQLEISLEGETYLFSSEESGDTRTFFYGERELETDELQSALSALTADEFTQEAPSNTQEIALTVFLDNEQFPQVEIELYRYDSTHCLVVVDETPLSLVPRSKVVDLTEAVRALVWES